jgi:hypothetical protein
LYNADIVFVEDSDAIIIAKLGKRDERTGLEIVKGERRLGFVTKARRKWKDTTYSGLHFVAAGRENGRTVCDCSGVAEVRGI